MQLIYVSFTGSSIERTSTIAKCWQWFCKMMCRNNNDEHLRQEQGIIELQHANLTVSQPTLGIKIIIEYNRIIIIIILI